MADTGICGWEWDSSWEDGDSDGDGSHKCFRPEGHDDECVCADHFACVPVYWAPSRSA